MDAIARIHPATLERMGCETATEFVFKDTEYRIVRSDSVPVGDVDTDEGVLHLDDVPQG